MPDLVFRKARPCDVPAMLELINGYAHAGLMLPRTEFEMCENIRDFTVALLKDRAAANGDGNGSRHELAGCGALHFYTPQMAEVRSLAVSDKLKSAGVGRRIVDALVQEARDYGLDVVFAFTYVVGFFEKCGFQVVDRGSLPLKAWKDCVRCPHFNACDEVAMVCLLSPEAREAETSSAHDGLIHLSRHISGGPANDELIQIPTPARTGSGFQGR